MDPSLAAKIQAANSALIANGNLDAIGEFFTPDYVGHGTDQDMAGHGAIRGFLGVLRRAFPDLHVEVEILVEGEDRVSWQRTLRGSLRVLRLGLVVLLPALAGCRRATPASPQPLDWTAQDSARIAWLSVHGETLEGLRISARFPRDSIPASRIASLVKQLDGAIPALQEFIGGPYGWQRYGKEKIVYYFPADRFVSHVENAAVFVAAWRVRDSLAPLLHETLHVLLTGTAPFYPDEFTDTLAARRMGDALPLWLVEGFADYAAQAVAESIGFVEGDIFNSGGSSGVDSTCAARLRGPRGGEILPYIGARGRPAALFTSERQEVAPIFYACAHSFTKFLAKQTDAPFVASLFPEIPTGRVEARVHERTGRELSSLRAEWLRVIGATSSPNRR